MTVLKYTVKAGDTLSGIARAHNTSVAEILKRNTFIKNPDVIQVGWNLSIPSVPAKNYTAIGQKLEACLDDIEKLPSYKELLKVLGN